MYNSWFGEFSSEADELALQGSSQCIVLYRQQVQVT
jgi:hypothetical protein